MRRLRGMFAFAIWDERAHQLVLARDRMGIKPLYYTTGSGRFGFASQVKTLVAGGLATARLSSEGVRSFLSFGAVSEPLTILDDVLALPAGHIGRLDGATLSVEPYWVPSLEARMPNLDGPGELREFLAETVAAHLVSDAPIGVFLSGGLDSSLLAALAVQSSHDVRTVSIEFVEAEFNEGRYIEAVATWIGSKHTSVELMPRELLESLPAAFSAMDQPTFDGLNTFAVSRAAADAGLKVAVSGLGADELFDGYGHMARLRALGRLAVLPRPLARFAPRLLTRDPVRAQKLSYWLEQRRGEQDAYDVLRRLFLPSQVARLAGADDSAPRTTAWSQNGDHYRELSLRDLESYTRNVLLRDTDSMSMANSLEVRVPYLDDHFADAVLAMPAAVKGERKQLLIQAAEGLVPDEVLKRKKHGFLVPFERWLAADLREEVGAALAAPPAELENVVDAHALLDVWVDYTAGGTSWLRPWALYALVRWTADIRPVAVAGFR